MRYFMLFFIVIEFVYASSGFCFTMPIEMTKLKNEDEDFAFYLQCVDVWEGEVWTVLTVFPKKPGKWDYSYVWINVFKGEEFIVRASIDELAEKDDFESKIGKKPEGATRYLVMINPKYFEHSYLSYNVGYSRSIEKKLENGFTITPVSFNAEYILNFKDFIKMEPWMK